MSRAQATPYEEGSPEAKICVLAEAPARVEVRLGRPLVGPSGDVFNDCLRTVQIAREACYILNIWPYQVVKDKRTDDFYDPNGAKLWDHNKGITAYGLKEAAGCIERLHNSKANIILGLGRPALNLLSGEMKPIMKWRGSLLWSDIFDRKYLPTIHPAATLHGTYNWRYIIQNDMAKMKMECLDRKLQLPHRELIIGPSFNAVMNFMAACEQYKRFNTDLEILNRQVYCMSLATYPWLSMTVPFVDRDGQPYWTEEQEVQIWQRYAALMANPEVTKVNQNLVGFDAVFLFMQNYIHTRGPLGDPMIAQHIMYPHFPKGLDFIASFHTREPYWKDEGKIWKAKEFREIPWEQFQTYCAKDSAVSLEAWEVLAQEMTDGGYWDTYNMTVQMAPALAYMGVRGLKVNLRGIQQTNVRITEEIKEKQAELNELCGRELNVSSPKDCVNYFYHELGLPPYVGPSGSPTTDDKAMARIVRKASRGSKEAKKVQEIRAHKKLKGTYLETELDMDGRLRCSWNPRGAWTGRLSSSKTIFQTGLDLQNLHPNFKGFIVSDMEGKT